MVDLIDNKGDEYITPDLEKINRAINHNSFGKIRTTENPTKNKKGEENGQKSTEKK